LQKNFPLFFFAKKIKSVLIDTLTNPGNFLNKRKKEKEKKRNINFYH
jgi:hypothetical protein